MFLRVQDIKWLMWVWAECRVDAATIGSKHPGSLAAGRPTTSLQLFTGPRVQHQQHSSLFEMKILDHFVSKCPVDEQMHHT
jgi:hypothetical protein